MAKYNRFDPRNKKKAFLRHKNQYLGRTQKPIRRELDDDDRNLQQYYDFSVAKINKPIGSANQSPNNRYSLMILMR